MKKKASKSEEAYLGISAILDSIDAVVYLTDMETCELVFMNKYGKRTWGEIEGKRCWEVLQAGQTGPCPFCTNDKLVDKEGNATGVYIWEFQNTVNQRWFHCRDRSIQWIDGRMLRMEIATDITDIKRVGEELKIAKEQAEKLSRTDDLTGIRNRRATFEDGINTFKLSKRYNFSTSIIMLDIDHFKQVNDQYGHFTGDRVLVDFARIIEKNIREVDIFGRIGGEEFTLILPETNLFQAFKFADRLRTIILSMAIEDAEGHRLNISSSFGVASGDNEHQSFEQVLTHADKALYQAKLNGRNRVECYLPHHDFDLKKLGSNDI